VSKQNSTSKASTTFISTLSILELVELVFKVLTPSHFLSISSWLTIEPLDQDVVEDFPSVAAIFEKFQDLFKMNLDVPGQTCVYLAAGKAKHVLKGKYFDCEQNIQTVVDHAEEIPKHDLYELKVEFLGGLPNDGGTAKDEFGER
jgi:hypothetical protein